MGRILDGLRHRGLLTTVAVVAVLVVLFSVVPKIPQPEAYHRFTDRRTLIGGVPNTMNVVSNFPFLIIGVFGVVNSVYGNRFGFTSFGEMAGWTLFFSGVTATAFGSAYYHLRPNDSRLVWDRLPMTVAFTSLMVIFVIERVSEKGGTLLLLPTVAVGAASVAYWRYTDDLRPYLLVQFTPLLLIPLMALATPSKYSHSHIWLWASAYYVAAKFAEYGDRFVFRMTGENVSGHTLKHLLAAVVPIYILVMLHHRFLLVERISELERWGWRRRREGLVLDEERGGDLAAVPEEGVEERKGLLGRGS